MLLQDNLQFNQKKQKKEKMYCFSIYSVLLYLIISSDLRQM